MVNEEMVGRAKEKILLQQALSSQLSELIAALGQRRVDKPFLINTAYKDKIDFESMGIQKSSLQRQLKNFTFALSEKSEKPAEKPGDWFDAFVQLIDFLKKKRTPINKTSQAYL